MSTSFFRTIMLTLNDYFSTIINFFEFLALLQKGDYNVVVIDWSPISKMPYIVAANSVRNVGKHVAYMLNYLMSHGMSPETTTLIGHSLGAHVVGIAGHNAEKKINFIYGMDFFTKVYFSAACL